MGVGRGRDIRCEEVGVGFPWLEGEGGEVFLGFGFLAAGFVGGDAAGREESGGALFSGTREVSAVSGEDVSWRL